MDKLIDGIITIIGNLILAAAFIISTLWNVLTTGHRDGNQP